MSDSPVMKSVLIPLAGDGGGVGEIEAWGRVTDQRVRGVDPALVELLPVGAIYDAAAQAYDCVRRLPYTRWGGQWRRHTSLDKMTLTMWPVAAFQDVPDGAGRSAELGAALAMLMLQRFSPHATVAATGALERAQGNRLDAEITPVDGLKEKFEALGRYLQDNKGGAWGSELIVLVPKTTRDRRLIEEAHEEDLTALKQVGADAGVEVKILPVGLLSEAAEKVGALKPALRVKAISKAIAGALMALSLVGVMAWAAQTPEIKFSSVLVGSVSIPTPVRSVYDQRYNRIYPAKACVGEDGSQHIPIGQGLTILVEVDGQSFPVRMHDFMIVSIGETSLVKVYPSEALDPAGQPVYHDGRIRFGARLAIEDPAESMKLFVLARRRLPWIGGRFDAGAIKFGLEAVLQNTELDARINQAMVYMDTLPGARLEVGFEAVEGVLGEAVVNEQGELETKCEFVESVVESTS